MEELMFECLYCGKNKPAEEASLEHAIPQFLGGRRAPVRFQLTNVCARCNNLLGLFVDAAFGKGLFPVHALAAQARLLCTSENDPGLPLAYMGEAQVADLVVPEGQVADHWIGPSGEVVIWIRPYDARMVLYAGGNPIDSREEQTTVYYAPKSNDDRRLVLGFNSFRHMFAHKNARRILCARIVDEDGKEVEATLPGFDTPDAVEKTAAAAILRQIDTGRLSAKSVVDATFDHRFICKFALGVGYGLFGDPFLAQPLAADYRVVVWPRRDEPSPAIRGVSTFSAPDRSMAEATHYPGAVVMAVLRGREYWSLTLTVDSRHSFTVLLGPISLVATDVDLAEGYVLVLVPYLDQAIELSVAAMAAHRVGALPHPDLAALDRRLRHAEAFWQQLA